MIQKPLRPLRTTSSTAASLTTFGIALGRYTPAVQERPPTKPIVEIAPPDHPIYSLVGRVASGWAHLEHTLDLIIWDLTRIEPESVACITAQINGVTPRYRAIVSLLKHRKTDTFNKLAEKMEELMRKTYDPTEQHNRIVHDPWYITHEKLPAQFRAMPTKDPRFGICEIDAKEIEALITTANKLAESRLPACYC